MSTQINDFKQQVRSQICSDLSDTLNSLHIHKGKLLDLKERLEDAKNQVLLSADQTEEKIETTFDQLLRATEQEILLRKNTLLSQVKQTQEEALTPLIKCGSVLQAAVDEADKRLEQGKRLQQAKTPVSKETVFNFQETAASMTSLPEVPDLFAVPCITIQFPEEPLSTTLANLINTAGVLSKIGPVQITETFERPGALLVCWGEVEEDEDGMQHEFRLEFSQAGCTSIDSANFRLVYIGCDYSAVVRDLCPDEKYLMRISCRKEHSKLWSAWSLPKMAYTTLEPFTWSETSLCSGGWSVANKGSLASKLAADTSVITSNGPVLRAEMSILFEILSSGTGCSDEGIGLSWTEPTQGCHLEPGSLFLNVEGCILLDGAPRVTKLPALTSRSRISFSLEELQLGKIRVAVEHKDKQVTYDWASPSRNRSALYFFATFVDPKWTIAVR